VGHHVVFADGLAEQALGKFSAFSARKQPARDAAGEDIDDDLQASDRDPTYVAPHKEWVARDTRGNWRMRGMPR
jgi:hypothetical protein